MVFYSQRDPKWANVIYSAKPPHTETIKSSGCGICSAASVVSSLAGVTVEPPEMAAWSVAHGFRIDGVGTANELFSAVAKKYGLSFKVTYSVKEALKCTADGGLCVCGTSGKPRGIFSTGGHFFLLVGGNGDRLKFFDPDCYSGKYQSHGRAKYARVVDGFVLINLAWANGEINQYYMMKKEGLTVGQYEELKERIDALEKPMVYNYIDENMPEWARGSVQKLASKGWLGGSEAGLGLTDDMLRMIVVLDRAGAFGE